MVEQLAPYQVMYDYSDVPTIRRFALNDKRIRCLMGPFGCISGNSLIITEQGLLRISDIDRPMRVLSWNEKNNRCEMSLSGGAFPKKTGNLYRIVTESGEIHADGHHRVLSSSGEYLSVGSLIVGDLLAVYSQGQTDSTEEPVGVKNISNVQRYSQKAVDSLGNYANEARQYGQQLLREANIFPDVVPLPIDVRESFRSSFGVDAQGEQIQVRNQHNLSGVRVSTLENHNPSSVLLEGDGGDLTSGPCSQHNQSYIGTQVAPSSYSGSLLTSELHHITTSKERFDVRPLLSSGPSLLNTSLMELTTIIHIEIIKGKYLFWDMQVLDTNNYITSDGTIHHNSGKSSGCVIEILRRAQAQKPGPDGMRRSRWVVVRNSYGQLKDTTIKTFHDWFPPKIFGEWRVTDHTYIFTKLIPHGIHLEVLFRALDRPDQVSNLLSLEVTGAWFNEVREIPKAIIDAMDSRIGRYPSKRDGGPTWHGMIFDTNPPDEDSWLYRVFEKQRPDNWQMFKQPSGLSVHAENTKHLPGGVGYYKNLAKGKDEMYIRIYIHGQYGYLIQGKPVFQSFRDNIHVAPHILEPMKGVDVLIGFDFGLQPACTLGQITPLGQLRILDELVSDGMGLRQFCENQLIPLLRTKYFGMNVMGYGDPSGTSRSPTDETTCYEILGSSAIGLGNIVPAPSNALTPRVGAVEMFLNKMNFGEPGFILSPNCHSIRKALNGAYHYDKDPKGSGDEYKAVPVKNFASHIADSLEYLCMYVTEKEMYDKQRKSFLANLKQKTYHPASDTVGY